MKLQMATAAFPFRALCSARPNPWFPRGQMMTILAGAGGLELTRLPPVVQKIVEKMAEHHRN